ncbi:MAG TPA: hypothetical protein PLQ92_05940 [Methanomassiliicoccales archaeon]|nr:hypothetical protein [Methanomassiliicoccales archaeon]
MDQKERQLLTHRASDELGKFSMWLRLYITDPLDGARSEKMVLDLMNGITKECFARGADMIGHVKSFLTAEGGSTISVSLIDLDIPPTVQNRFDGTMMSRGELIVHVIVHGMWDPQVRETSLEFTKGFMAERSIDYEVINDFYEKEKRVKD